MRRGLTLLELLISLVIVVIVISSSMRAFSVAAGFDQKIRDGRNADAERQNFEATVTDLLHHAWLSTSTTNQNSFFIGGSVSQTASTSNLPSALRSTISTSQTPGGASTSSGSTSSGNTTGAYGTPNTIVFTAGGLPLSAAYLASNDDPETQNQNFGPQGGIREVELSENPVGSQGQGKTGVFLRVQTPVDNDPTQGGNESLLTSKVSQIGFEFFDGAEWATAWDSREQTPAPGDMPSAVRVTYKFTGDDYDHVFIVRIPSSKVTYLNPVTVTGGS